MVLRISRKAMVAEWTEQSFEENRRDITIRTHTFLHKHMYLDNELCKVFNDRATAELRA